MVNVTTRPATEHDVDAYFELRDTSMSLLSRLGCALFAALVVGGSAILIVGLARMLYLWMQPQAVTGPIVWYSGAIVAILTAVVVLFSLAGSGTKKPEPRTIPASVEVITATADAAWVADASFDPDEDDRLYYLIFQVGPNAVLVINAASAHEIEPTDQRVGTKIAAEFIGERKDRWALQFRVEGDTIPLTPLPESTPGLRILDDYEDRVVNLDEFPASLHAVFSPGLS
jgi:hypothetical protein